MSTKVTDIILNNKLLIPQLGLGVWQANDGSEVESAVTSAINAGYRLIDTAAIYGNETGVGRAIKNSNVAREELFITTKVWNGDQGYDKTLAAFDHSMKLLGLEYLDMYLIHWPLPAKALYNETWKAMEELYNQGRVKAIGVCNFQIPHLQDLMAHATIQPAVNQIELHPYFPQTELRKFAKENNIAIESWSPIGGKGGTGGNSSHDVPLLEQPILTTIGLKYNKTPAQVVIRWHIQNGLIVIPKSVHEDRIKQNFDVFDFELTDDDMKAINGLETGKRGGANPDTFNFN
ncbi:MAG: glyoxal reductase [Candidatus Saccharibacteria bacterium]|nr:glyoxal reductase [Candidatus Saccharibacteria bacterium]